MTVDREILSPSLWYHGGLGWNSASVCVSDQGTGSIAVLKAMMKATVRAVLSYSLEYRIVGSSCGGDDLVHPPLVSTPVHAFAVQTYGQCRTEYSIQSTMS